jgi:hypothetical protein
MYRFYIDGSDTKKFMNLLLKDDKFDKFECRSCEITTVASFSLDGRLNGDFFDEAPNRAYCLWSEVRSQIFYLIKGKRKPKVFKIVLALGEKSAEKLHPNAKVCFLNIVFENDKNDSVVFTTGTAQKEFSLDKGVDEVWEGMIRSFFKKLELTVLTS